MVYGISWHSVQTNRITRSLKIVLSPQWNFLYWEDVIFVLNQAPVTPVVVSRCERRIQFIHERFDMKLNIPSKLCICTLFFSTTVHVTHLYNYIIYKSIICVKVVVRYMFFLGPKAKHDWVFRLMWPHWWYQRQLLAWNLVIVQFIILSGTDCPLSDWP